MIELVAGLFILGIVGGILIKGSENFAVVVTNVLGGALMALNDLDTKPKKEPVE